MPEVQKEFRTIEFSSCGKRVTADVWVINLVDIG